MHIQVRMITSYLDQLNQIADDTGWNLADACVDSGIAVTTYYRWIKKICSPREKQARIVADYMARYART